MKSVRHEVFFCYKKKLSDFHLQDWLGSRASRNGEVCGFTLVQSCAPPLISMHGGEDIYGH